MDSFTSALLSAIIIAIILVIAAFIWYQFGTWAPFSFKIRELPRWVASNDDVTRLRFRNCKFNVVVGADIAPPSAYAVPEMSKKEASRDVTNILNLMAKQYVGGNTLTLARPLNPFSFTIVGFNDTNAMTNIDLSKEKTRWCPVKQSCVSDTDCIGGASGSCMDSGYCVNCDGMNTATLTGEYRVV